MLSLVLISCFPVFSSYDYIWFYLRLLVVAEDNKVVVCEVSRHRPLFSGGWCVCVCVGGGGGDNIPP